MKEFLQQLFNNIGTSRYFAILVLSGLSLVSKIKPEISKPVIQHLTKISDYTFPIALFCFWTSVFSFVVGLFILLLIAAKKKFHERQEDVYNKEIAKLNIQLFWNCMITILLAGWFFGILLYNMR